MQTSAALAPVPPVASSADPAARPSAPAGTWPDALRASALLVLLSTLILAVLWGGIAWQIQRERSEELRNAQTNLTNLARAFSEHTAKTLEGADQAIRFIRNEYLERGKDLNIAAYLRDKQIIDSAFHLISIIGPDGYVSHSSQPFSAVQRVDLRDREHFKVHAAGSGDTLFISKPVLGRVSNKWSIQLTRRIDLADGSFGGVVVLSLTPEYLTRFYGDVDLGPRGAITLVGFDGVVRARATHGDSKGAQNLSAAPLFQEAMRRKTGTYRSVSTIDKVERLWAFRALDDYGLVVVTGMGVDDIMADARQRSANYIVAAGVLSLVIVAFVAGLVRRQRIQLQLMHQLEQSNAQATAANRMKTRFLASVSHELRTPLNGILGYAELIRDGGDDPATSEYAAAIHHSATRLHALVADILDLAKIESGRMEISRKPIALREVLIAAIDKHAAAAQAKGLKLRLDLAEDCPAQIVADRERLAQVLGNVLDNAIKFSEAGEIGVTAGVLGGRVSIAVRDQGHGIPPEQLPTLFTRFHSTAMDFVHPGQGPGIGLPLAYELMVLMGGSITVESRPGHGTTIALHLPISTSA